MKLRMCGAVLATPLIVSNLAAHPPRSFVQFGFGGTGSTVRPMPAIPGWNALRIYPSIGSGFRGFTPIVAVSVGVPFFPPLYLPSVYSPPVVVPTPIESIEIPPPAAAPPIRGQPAGRFRPVGPGDRERARMAPPNAPNPKPPAENPLVAQARMVREGRAAFANGEYGRAADWFQRSVAVAPQVAEGHFLLAQAWVALGKYADAAIEIHRGVLLDRTWHKTGPPIRDLYGPRQADFDRHRQLLEDAVADYPDVAALEFVLAYVDWFDGQRQAAQQAFDLLRHRVADSAVIDLFLAGP
jgi:hypothetical protein